MIDMYSGKKTPGIKTQSELAKRLGVSKQYLNRALKSGKKEFVVKSTGRDVLVTEAQVAFCQNSITLAKPRDLTDQEWNLVAKKLVNYVNSLSTATGPFPPEIDSSSPEVISESPPTPTPKLMVTSEATSESSPIPEKARLPKKVMDNVECERPENGFVIPMDKKCPLGEATTSGLNEFALQRLLDAFQKDGLSFLPAGFRVKGVEEKVKKGVEEKLLLVDPKLKDAWIPQTLEEINELLYSRKLCSLEREQWVAHPEESVLPLHVLSHLGEPHVWWRFKVIKAN